MSESSLTLDNVWRACAFLVFCLLLRYLQQRGLRTKRAASLQIHAAKKFKQRNDRRKQMHAAINKEGAFELPDAARQTFLLSLTATELHHHMHVARDVRCVEVVLLYALRAMAVGALTNAVTEEFASEALEAAKQVDARIAARAAGEDDSAPGVLEGIPLSIKDAFDMKGADSTCGFAARAFRPLPEDGLLVALLREAGGIPFVRTNVPQGLMVPESSNIIWGAAANPWNLDRTPGGSSGGEGALLAARGSILGLGSDIGGSLRIPSHFCGVYCFKPTPQRVSLDGLAIPCLGSVSGQLAVRPVAGPMGHSVDDLLLMLRAWLAPSSRMWAADVSMPRVPLDEDVIAGRTGERRLKIGYFENDGFFTAAPACSRAVRQAVVALQEAGHTVVRWSPPSIPTAVRCYYGIMSADSASGVLDGLEGEDVAENYKQLLMMLKIPRALRALIVRLLRTDTVGQLRAALLLQSICRKNAEELYAYHALALEWTANFTARWQEAGLDAVICPGVGLPALLHGGSRELTVACSYTFMWNLLHYPVGSVPIGLTESHELIYEETAGERAADAFTAKAANTVRGSLGLPVGVQVAALPWRDEVALRVMKDIERRVQFKDIPELANQLKV